ncbi:unnamed protein product [Medioppia subpectinata]|uniref:Uncharacterized protein n=1 Tax=Medioppia subpectinata TaxID=1979941 RepID=A0A7R9PXM3_9ACAR|nr:unnamed protein product [Medioppia subpectinata]CAG2105145.1 unnamed protein product [Medioppia subpectinata]
MRPPPLPQPVPLQPVVSPTQTILSVMFTSCRLRSQAVLFNTRTATSRSRSLQSSTFCQPDGATRLSAYLLAPAMGSLSTVLDRAQVIELPAITLCTHINNAIDVDYLRHRYPNDTALANITDTYENKWQYKSYLFNLTLEEQLINGTIGASRFFNYCRLRAPLALSVFDWANCSSVSPIVESINNYQKCFTMFNQNASQLADNNRYRVDHDATFRENGFNLFWFALNTRYVRELSVYMHDRRQPFVGRVEGQSTPMNFDHKHYGIIAIAYKEVDINRLPPPYRTQCADYTSLGYRSQKDWVSQCRIKYYRDQFSSWPPWTMYRREHYGNLNYAPMSIPGNRTMDKQISNHCAHRIGRRPDCHAVYYTMNTIVPTDTITRYIHSPRMELSEYMGIIGGVSGLWFGLNILAFYDIGNKRRSIPTSYIYSINKPGAHLSWPVMPHPDIGILCARAIIPHS